MTPRTDARLLLAAALFALGACAGTTAPARGPIAGPPADDATLAEATPAADVAETPEPAFTFLGLRGVSEPAPEAFAAEVSDGSAIHMPEFAELAALLDSVKSATRAPLDADGERVETAMATIDRSEPALVVSDAPAGGASDALAAPAPEAAMLDEAFAPDLAMEAEAERLAALRPTDFPSYWLAADDAPMSSDENTPLYAAIVTSSERAAAQAQRDADAQPSERAMVMHLAALENAYAPIMTPAADFDGADIMIATGAPAEPAPKVAAPHSTPMIVDADMLALSDVEAMMLPAAVAPEPAPAPSGASSKPLAGMVATEEPSSMAAVVSEADVGGATFPSGAPNWYGRDAEPVIVDTAAELDPMARPSVMTAEKVRPATGLPTLEDLLAEGPVEEVKLPGVRVIRRAE